MFILKICNYIEIHNINKAAINNQNIAIADARSAYWYANYVLNGRFELGEAIIATHFYYAYLYAKDVLKGSFPLGEPAIAMNIFCYEYTDQILKHDFL